MSDDTSTHDDVRKAQVFYRKERLQACLMASAFAALMCLTFGVGYGAWQDGQDVASFLWLFCTVGNSYCLYLEVTLAWRWHRVVREGDHLLALMDAMGKQEREDG